MSLQTRLAAFISAVGADIKALQGSVPVRGSVNLDGIIIRGTGFSVTRTSLGHYTVTFPAGKFAVAPVVVVGSVATAAWGGVHTGVDPAVARSATQVGVRITDPSSSGYLDAPFEFIAFPVPGPS